MLAFLTSYVCDRRPQQGWVILEAPEGAITDTAQKTANALTTGSFSWATRMVVIDMQLLDFTTDSTASALGFLKLLKFCK